ncbi:MAG: recombinase RecA [Elusimicrobia bacterium]|nr:recombinase RecA [Candidatus Obscuribacterium magneticum]
MPHEEKKKGPPPFFLNKEERQRALQMALSNIEKSYGKEAIMRLGEKRTDGIQVISTGVISLDIAIGVGGVPRGRVVEIFGPESSGKSTLCLSIAAQAQKQGGTAAYIDAEHAMDPLYAKKLGVDIDNLLISQPDSGEQALEITEQLVRSGAVDIIIIDSTAALVPRSEIEGEMGQPSVGVQARMMSQALRKLTAILGKSKTCIVFINQLRQKIGVFYGNPETTPGGLALKFYSSVRLDIRRLESIKTGDEVIGSHVRVKVVKNKVAPPFRQAEFDILFGSGISREACLVDMGAQSGLLEKSGAWYVYKGEKLGQGRDNAKDFLKQNPKKTDELEKAILSQYGLVIGKEAEKQPSLEKQPVASGKK